MAVIFHADGKRTMISPANGHDFSLAELKAAIGGGYIEIVNIRDGLLLVCDDDGRSKGLPPNAQATQLFSRFPDDDFVGDVLVCRVGEIE